MDRLNIFGFGILMIILGICIIWFVSKSSSTRPLFDIKFRGYALGVGLIIYGIIRIIQLN